MPLIRIKKSWEIPETEITPEKVYLNRRRFMKNLIGAGLSATALSTLTNCASNSTTSPISEAVTLPNISKFTSNPNFSQVERPITDEVLATTYNNFYEFGGTKSIWQNAQALPTENWKVEITGLVKNSRIYDIDQLQKKFPLEERIYRFRCVEAWAMVVPWLGFPMKLLMADVEPTSKAKYVRFTSFYNPQITKGPGFWAGGYPWPYTEGLRIDEMANELAFFAMGMYGKSLPKQNGAPLREVIPWKYGFKGAKSIVKIEFLEQRPATFWNTLAANEYGFEANVNPQVPHPRWSQATERIVGEGASWSWEKRPTLLYNGYEEYVGSLYS
ncbi:MAG: protein-methionine-sulfoxide reductase catalytic subunit MsrP [Okeania sp. SIO3I5]|uniref:protein-methionine-sulfoxide reductase catalytic subunit MsrP n=1 Tax=Okeania sp. SIO3I5 TaxID=2607805 RepID=UPI0013B8AB19|nr:protein-methionine-sulfoxide reductase catalytic subunit MsrP [Okeania sp. SIO3I5]NEQ37597.1 protein-methionine-sulfoxide reductase catalytic subunit MsrP [Okeania sp. SIO3I5]